MTNGLEVLVTQHDKIVRELVASPRTISGLKTLGADGTKALGEPLLLWGRGNAPSTFEGRAHACHKGVLGLAAVIL